MKIAIGEAIIGLKKKDGGPFGAVIVKNNKIIAKSHNQVLKTKDPTSHAEINVIRLASKKLKRFNLSDCELYTTCKPCPMCLSAIYWARINKVYFGAMPIDAEKIGFIDKELYDFFKERKNNKINLKKINRKECLEVMEKFNLDPNKKLY